MFGECQVNVQSLSELDIGGRETCLVMKVVNVKGQICSVLVVKMLVQSTLSILSECFKVWSWRESIS